METSPFTVSSSINLFWLVIKVILYLVFLGIIMWFILWIFKKKRFPQETGLINIIGTRAISPGKYIQIVEIVDRVLVLGIGESITVLSEIKDKETIDIIKTQMSREESSKNPNLPFSEYLKNFGKKMDFLDRQRKRLTSI
ncbi:TPA: hypothetical protein DCX16_04195 [bacterium]|nr:hypothetical protein [bacterium]